jgi:hypothetical protein
MGYRYQDPRGTTAIMMLLAVRLEDWVSGANAVR